MSSNKNNRTTFIVIITISVLLNLMLLVYGMVQRTNAIMQQKICVNMAEENVRLSQENKNAVQIARDQMMFAQAQAKMAADAVASCEKKTSGKK